MSRVRHRLALGDGKVTFIQPDAPTLQATLAAVRQKLVTMHRPVPDNCLLECGGRVLQSDAEVAALPANSIFSVLIGQSQATVVSRGEVRAVIAPGNGDGSIEDCLWYADVAAGLRQAGISCALKDFPDPVYAREEVWVPFMLQELGVDASTVVIGHSSGAAAAMRLAEKNKIRGLVLVSAYSNDLGDELEANSGYFNRPWDWAAIKRNTDWIVQFHANDDPFVPFEHGLAVHEALGSLLIALEEGGHFQFDRFPAIVDVVVKRTTQRDASAHVRQGRPFGQLRWAFNVDAWRPSSMELGAALIRLSAVEQARVRRFRRECDMRSALAGRLLIRQCVAEVYGVPGDLLTFERTKEGKPYLATELRDPRAPNFNFNLSHHGAWVVLAAEPRDLVGVDVMSIEMTDPGRGDEALQSFFHDMRHCFTAREWAVIRAPAPLLEPQLRLFFDHWTLKESYIKAVGIGLGFELQRAEFAYLGAERAGAAAVADGADGDDQRGRDGGAVVAAGAAGAAAGAGAEAAAAAAAAAAVSVPPRRRAQVALDGVQRADWRFETSYLDAMHVTSVSYGPVAQAMESYRSRLQLREPAAVPAPWPVCPGDASPGVGGAAEGGVADGGAGAGATGVPAGPARADAKGFAVLTIADLLKQRWRQRYHHQQQCACRLACSWNGRCLDIYA